MHIKLIKKKLLFKDYKVKCAFGKKGISSVKKEGDNCTPRGIFRITALLYRKDRIKKITTHLKKIKIDKNMGWCDDPKSRDYNKIITYPFKFSSEKLYKKNNIYDIILVVDYNLKPIKKNKGSAIFLHIATKQYKPTEGCIAVSKRNIKNLINDLKKNSRLQIY